MTDEIVLDHWVDAVDRYWYTHGIAIKVAIARARQTGHRQRVEQCDPHANAYQAPWQIVPVTVPADQIGVPA